MHLATMVRLMIEDVRQRIDELLLDIGRPADGPIAHLAGEVVIAKPRHIGDDACILGDPRRTQRAEVVMQNGVEPRRSFALAGQALHPDAIADQKVIERAVHRAEKGAVVGAVLGIGSVAAAA